ncbi:predicted protein [Nematostella vectensis]|uniref:Uncharacterized protein n=1 Tax=Nematostella vectensis TaxID=45351 RepID=A7T2N9_NEMVE|nr:predicted protein [Nematostella vectensis]|eukprot:XP_001621875.1 hypothetical protein NEMVEDRAFT_v1g221475 [Nematostella vectensis]
MRMGYFLGLFSTLTKAKVGGDKGGESIKLLFEIVNLKNPNSSKNSVVFSTFEAPDCAHNMELGVQRYMMDTEDLEKKPWRNKQIKVIVAGDCLSVFNLLTVRCKW